tara:strand:- start:63 stop:800 length:738 start_codon:yes stop_codon:yes gene_type:complete
MAFKMKGSPFHQMESDAQQRKNLMNDNPVDSKASALNKMDPMHNGEPGVQKEDFEQFSSPMNQGRKVKKAAKTQAQIDKIRKSFGTKDADVSGRFERKRKKMDKTVSQLEKKGVKVDFDTTSAEGEGASRKTTKKTSYVSVKKKKKDSPMNQGKKSKTKKFPKGDVRNRPGTKGPKDTKRSGEATAEAKRIKVKEKKIPQTMSAQEYKMMLIKDGMRKSGKFKVPKQKEKIQMKVKEELGKIKSS